MISIADIFKNRDSWNILALEGKIMDRYHTIAKCMDIWMGLREKEYSINEYFKVRDVHKVGIYGYGILGRHFIWELEQSDRLIGIEWILDKRADKITTAQYPVYQPEALETLSEPDLIVVCAINDFDEVEAFVSARARSRVVSLKTIIEECNRKAQMEMNL